MSEGSLTLRMRRLKEEKQARGKDCRQIIFYSFQVARVPGNIFPFSVKMISEKAGWLMRMGALIRRKSLRSRGKQNQRDHLVEGKR